MKRTDPATAAAPMATSALAILSALLLAGAAVGAAAQSTTPTTTLYRWVDSDGIVHYSDRPQPGAQVIHIQSAQTYSAPPPPKTDTSKASDRPLEPSPYQSCAIVEPGQESTFANPENVPISVRISPGLRQGDQLEVSVDGAALAPAGGGGLQYQLTAPDRGAHTVTAAVRDADGKAVCQAAPVTFSVQRTSLLSPQSPLRPH